MFEHIKEDVGALERLINGELDLDYQYWQLDEPTGTEDEGTILAVYAPDMRYAAFQTGRKDPCGRLLPKLIRGVLDSSVLEEDRDTIRSWWQLGEQGTQEVLSLHAERTAAAGVPLSFISFGVDLGGGIVTRLYHPAELPVTLCFDWLQHAARRAMAQCN